MRATLVQLITQYQPDLLVGDPDAMTTRQLLALAESCVPKDPPIDPPASTAPRITNVWDICDPTTRVGRLHELRRQRHQRREEAARYRAEREEQRERYYEQLRERSRKRGLLDPAPMFKPDVY